MCVSSLIIYAFGIVNSSTSFGSTYIVEILVLVRSYIYYSNALDSYEQSEYTQVAHQCECKGVNELSNSVMKES